MKLEPYVCPQCGGKVNRVTMVCEHCGTQFKEETDLIKIVAERPGVHTIKGAWRMPMEFVHEFGAEKASEIALHEMAKELANCIMPYIKVEMAYDHLFRYNAVDIRGEIRILDPYVTES